MPNSDRAFLNQLETTIDELKENPTKHRIEIVTLQALKDICTQVFDTNKKMDIHEKYPSLTYLVRRKPLMSIPYSIAIFMGFSSIYIDEVRLAFFDVLGISNIGATFETILLPVMMVCIVLGLIGSTKYKNNRNSD